MLIGAGAGDGEGMAVVFGGDCEDERGGAFRPRFGRRIGIGAFGPGLPKHVRIDNARIERHGAIPSGSSSATRLGEAFDREFRGAVSATPGETLRPQPDDRLMITPLCARPWQARNSESH